MKYIRRPQPRDNTEKNRFTAKLPKTPLRIMLTTITVREKPFCLVGFIGRDFSIF
jgi:hypothetical protein